MSSLPMTPDEAFKRFTQRTARVLRAHGFQGSGANYRRARGEQWQAFNIQKSQWRVNREDAISFYINIGLDYPELRFKRWLPIAPTLGKFIATKAETSLRIDELFPECRLDRVDWFIAGGLDGWNTEEACARFERTLLEKLMPRLDEMATREGLARVLRIMPWWVSAGSRAFVGESLAPPAWDKADVGMWRQDEEGLWWKQGE